MLVETQQAQAGVIWTSSKGIIIKRSCYYEVKSYMYG